MKIDYKKVIPFTGWVSVLLILCISKFTSVTRDGFVHSWLKHYVSTNIPPPTDPFFLQLSAAAIERTKHPARYDPAYIAIPYPNGDVPLDIGVCADEIVRTYRALGTDLQKEVHDDMIQAFSSYPKMWQQLTPDSNIDHRRVPNLMTFFSRKGIRLPLSFDEAPYFPGEIVAWELPNGLLHIGIVVEPRTSNGRRHLIVHNIGRGPQMEDALFVGKIIGHFRYKKKA